MTTQEAGANPARSRHCDRGANLLGHSHEAGRRGKRRSESQETRVIVSCYPGAVHPEKADPS
jgi:hypothetical protein